MRLSIASLLVATTVLAAAEQAGLQDIATPEVLRFIKSADKVYVFPVVTPAKPHRDDAHMRLLGEEAHRSLVALLGSPQNWYQGLFTIGIPDEPTNIGLVFRQGRDELVLFFLTQGEPLGPVIEGTFHGQRMNGMLQDKPGKEMEQWKQHYAKHELTAK